MKKYDTVIFDLDGTLLNTLDDLADSANFALSLYDLPNRTTDEVRRFLGNGVAKLIERCIPNGRQNEYYEKCLADFRKHYSKNMQNKTTPYTGIMELLGQLSEKGYKIAIVSNKFDSAVKGLNELYFNKYIKVAIGEMESEGVAKKPAPDTVFKALKELRSTPDRAVYVGDSEVDVKTAKNSGLPCVGVTWGFRNRQILNDEGANYIIDKPEQLVEIVY
ncbi:MULTISPECIES: HAD family hydrolase [Clostridium]|uniref:HAD family hydrolase n=1 Tax=Clostridium TaxID=1485 RepID=UPI0008248EC7|nr:MULTISPECIES: HAD family hydrolase [Clostridium]PJI09264.1 HAD family hydrolase [Clostridium sp. CT7]